MNVYSIYVSYRMTKRCIWANSEDAF